jgi:drug/metabolite transporter (DMT)-like permease
MVKMETVPAKQAASGTRWWDAMALLAVIWGSSFLFMKVAITELPPIWVTAFRVMIGAATLLVIVFATKQKLPRGWRVWGHLAVCAFIGNVLPFTLFAYGEQYVPSIAAGIWNAATPLMTVGVAPLILPNERLTRERALGVPIGFLGVLVILGVWSLSGGNTLIGHLACLGAATCYAFSAPYSKKYLADRKESGLVLAAGQISMAAAEALILAPIVSGRWPSNPMHWSPSVIGCLLALGALGTGLAFVLNYRLIRRAGAVNSSLVTYLMPVVATLAGLLVLHEHIKWNLPVGALVILAGVAIVQGKIRVRRV